ncbi:1-aminocyclopropane-1-carboxylate deaminase/D-cysteine desulfhydrase [Bacteroidota bacterium]
MTTNISSDINEYNAVIQEVKMPGVGKNISVFIKRLDLIHPVISGNKWYKLKYNLIEARKKGYETLLTFGGAFSNHIHATAAVGKLFEFKTIGFIRGEEHLPLNPTLDFATKQDMELFYVDRQSYRNKNSPEFLNKIRKNFQHVYILPEGGTNSLAVKGCSEIINSIDINFNYICTPVGTGGTISGLIAGLKEQKSIMGFSVLKNGYFLSGNIGDLLNDYNNINYKNWQINHDYHFEGYAKLNLELINFIDEFKQINDIQLDYVYTSKMMYGIFDLIRKKVFEPKSVIIALHTGGVQGNSGMNQRVEKLLIKEKFI